MAASFGLLRAASFGLRNAVRSPVWTPASAVTVGLPAMASAALWQLRTGLEQAYWLSPFVFASGKGKVTIQSRKYVALTYTHRANARVYGRAVSRKYICGSCK